MSTTELKIATKSQVLLRTESEDYIIPGKLKRTEDSPIGHGHYSYFHRIKFSGPEDLLNSLVHKKITSAKDYLETKDIILPEIKVSYFPDYGIAQIYAEEYNGGKTYYGIKNGIHKLVKGLIDDLALYLEEFYGSE